MKLRINGVDIEGNPPDLRRLLGIPSVEENVEQRIEIAESIQKTVKGKEEAQARRAATIGSVCLGCVYEGSLSGEKHAHIVSCPKSELQQLRASCRGCELALRGVAAPHTESCQNLLKPLTGKVSR